MTRPPGEQPPIQVISLRATPHRRQRFVDLNHGFRFEFFDAVDGRQIDKSKFFGSPLAQADVPYSPGAIGCALSHLTLWERSIREQAILTVVEDDAILRQDFEAKSQELIARLPPDWDIIMWGWNFDSILSVLAMPGVSTTVISFSQNSLRQAIGRFQTELFEPHIFRLDKCFGTCAYSISPAGSRKFRQGCFPLRPEKVFFPYLNRVLPNDGIDIAMNRIYPTTNSYVSFPPLAVTPNDNSQSLTLTRQPGPDNRA
jgi:glycosyl transferase, family 25